MRMGNWIFSPFTDLPASLPQIPPSQLAYEAGFLSNWNKFLWCKQAASRMLPSQKSLKADNFFRSKGNNRLIEISKFSPFKRVTQISLQLQSSHHTGSHIPAQHLVTRFSPSLCPQHD